SSRHCFSHPAHARTTEVHASLTGEDSRECTTTPLGMERTVLQGVLLAETLEGLFQLAGDLGGAPRARTIHPALGTMLGKALHPCADGGMSHMERLGDGVEMVAHHDLTDGLGTANDPRRFGLLQHGIEGRERMIGKVAFEGAPRFAPWRRMPFV